LGEGKTFAEFPGKPRLDDDRWASRYFIQGVADFTDNTHLELLHEEQYHLPFTDAVAMTVNNVKAVQDSKLTVDFNATKHTSAVGELEFLDDGNKDAIGPDGKNFSMERSKIQVNTQTNKYLFVAVYAEQIRNALQRRFLDPNNNVIFPLSLNAQKVIRPQ